MPGQTPNLALPYPLGPEPIDIAGDIQRLADASDAAILGRVDRDGDTMTGLLVASGGIRIGSTSPNRIILNEDGSATFEQGAVIGVGSTAIHLNEDGSIGARSIGLDIDNGLSFGTLITSGNPDYGQGIRFATFSSGGNPGLGYQQSYVYLRSEQAGGGFAWYSGGLHSDAPLEPGSGGIHLMSLNAVDSGLYLGDLDISSAGGGTIAHQHPGQMTLWGGQSGGLIEFRSRAFGANPVKGGQASAWLWDDGTWFQVNATNQPSGEGTDLGLLLRSQAANVRVHAFTAVDIYAGNAHSTHFSENNSVFIGKSTHNDDVAGLEWYSPYNSLRATCNVEARANLVCNRVGPATGTSTGEPYIVFAVQADGNVGSITRNAAGVAYNTTSDYRSKTVSGPVTGALDRLKALNPVMATYNADATQTEVSTFLAHEVAEVVPSAVSGDKDAVDTEGNPIYQQLDMSRLIPLIVAAIKELAA